MDPPVTPSKQKEDPRITIRHLNSKWKLDLREEDLASPYPKSVTAPQQPPPQLCVKIIRFLCYQNKRALERAISNFEEWARAIATEWRWKPRQERGTLPLRKLEESALLQNSLLEKVDMTESKRAELIAYLLRLLQDESYLMKGPPEFRPSGKSKGTPTFVPEAQGAEQASMLNNLPRIKTFSALEAEAKEMKKHEPKSKNKRKSLDAEVLIAHNSPIFSDNSPIFDDFDPEPFSPTSGNARANNHDHDHDTNYDEVQDENVPPPKKRSSRSSSKSSKSSIRDFFPAPKDLPPPEILDPPHFALPPPPLAAAPTAGLSFTSTVSTGSTHGSVFDAPDKLEPSTQDTEASIFNDIFESFESDQRTIVDGHMRGGIEGVLRRELEESGPFRKDIINQECIDTDCVRETFNPSAVDTFALCI